MKIISTIKEFFETTINTTEMLKRQRLKNKMLKKTEYLEPYSLPKRPFTIKNMLIKWLTHLVLHYDDLHGEKYTCTQCGTTYKVKYKKGSYGRDFIVNDGFRKDGYLLHNILCRKCAEKGNEILFDLNHPIIKYLDAKNKFDSIKHTCFLHVANNFLTNLSEKVLDELSHEAFEESKNTKDINSKIIARKAAIIYREQVKTQLKEYICKKLSEDETFKKAKNELNEPREKLVQYLDNSDKLIYGIQSYAVNNNFDEYRKFSFNPDDIFGISAEYSKKNLMRQISNEDKIYGLDYDEFYRNFLETIVKIFNSMK